MGRRLAIRGIKSGLAPNLLLPLLGLVDKLLSIGTSLFDSSSTFLFGLCGDNPDWQGVSPRLREVARAREWLLDLSDFEYVFKWVTKSSKSFCR